MSDRDIYLPTPHLPSFRLLSETRDCQRQTNHAFKRRSFVIRSGSMSLDP